MPVFILFIAFALSMIWNSCTYAISGIPVVPLSVMKQNNPEEHAKEDSKLIHDKTVAGENNITVMNRNIIIMEPGVHQIVKMGINHLNRIITPFENPLIKGSMIKTDSVKTDINGNVVYIASTSNHPISLFITESGDETIALSITLVPHHIPPREITLKLKDNINIQLDTQYKQAMQWEQSQPLYNTIESLLRILALKQIPPGYKLYSENAADHHCKQTGLRFSFSNSQLIKGHDLMVIIGVATNTSPHPIEFQEYHCGNWDVVAVSSYPYSAIDPGENTEIFIVKRIINNNVKEHNIKRQSLLNENTVE
ncbi:MAG: type-F conjugative transfer system secretin TraK [Candidatus Thiodiazotropha endolucinida]|nr:type-F conjugative transfer system secretin TraK [Candidatus Thiodiazotropha taylori]MCW4225208.1 type-F conjugative transfer system secretin TraK [Candidatus Thiodiazotropha endolucinida]MCG7880760.1 type-F conjugative transfer system secretin TraK [Candidatus Thiodiazotropha taylori]MCG7886779.1 type-F conjugative transfer system secretin TraK [Candidatus Thiodiazotropha taylori]MCG8028167.1 type-F conjugative transfer system secretin TraK [Candidatus Thiodiazotropha taylori]